MSEDKSAKDLRHEQFLKDIRALKSQPSGRGLNAALKRAAGKSFADSRGTAAVERLIQRAYPGSEAEREVLYLVATLIPLTKADGTQTIAQALRSIEPDASKPAFGTLERRFMTLTDAEFEDGDPTIGPGELGFRLAQTVRLLESKGKSIHWMRLLNDLLMWTHERKYSQKKWIKEFYRAAGETPEAHAESQVNLPEQPALDL